MGSSEVASHAVMLPGLLRSAASHASSPSSSMPTRPSLASCYLPGRYVTPGAFFESARAAGLSEADIAAGDQRRILQARGPALPLPAQPCHGTKRLQCTSAAHSVAVLLVATAPF